MTKEREEWLAEKLANYEAWAERVRPEDLVEADMGGLREITRLVEQREEIERALVEAVQAARAAKRSWAEIGFFLGVSKQAAQQKYAKLVST